MAGDEGIDIRALPYACTRTESSLPCNYRFGRYPDGSLKLQASYLWWDGLATRVTWRDVPVVDVDDQGNEVSRETPPD